MICTILATVPYQWKGAAYLGLGLGLRCQPRLLRRLGLGNRLGLRLGLRLRLGRRPRNRLSLSLGLRRRQRRLAHDSGLRRLDRSLRVGLGLSGAGAG